MRPLLYYHTLKYLRPVQIATRLRHTLSNPRPGGGPPPAKRAADGKWTSPPPKLPSMIGPLRFEFLQRTESIITAADWNAAGLPRLWRYNLHYFDDLNAAWASERLLWHEEYLRRWIADNPPCAGTGWEPFPLSLRIVNWIKWSLAGGSLPPGALQSLALQVRALRQRIERQDPGNHLIANAKALIFAGLFFDGEEAASWLREGGSLLGREIPQQILADGGHFERSPMYHAIVLEDLLDIWNLFRLYPAAHPERFTLPPEVLRAAIGRMRRWLLQMCHPDGEIALFNDACIGVAPCPAALSEYAARLRLGAAALAPRALTVMKNTGYVRLEAGPAVLLLDAGELGPDFLPGHGHADTLTFELSLFGQRLIVDPGVSTYEPGPAREADRGTRSHNTVTVEGKDSSEVWGSFRVGRRARPCGLIARQTGDVVEVACAHDGYARLPLRTIHRRQWRLTPTGLEIRDLLQGRIRSARAGVLLHPEVCADERCVERTEDGASGEWRLKTGQRIRWHVVGGQSLYAPAWYHSSMGRGRETTRLEYTIPGTESTLSLSWDH